MNNSFECTRCKELQLDADCMTLQCLECYLEENENEIKQEKIFIN